MRVSLNRKLCRKCGLCYAICPEVFERGTKGFAQLRVQTVPTDDEIPEFCVYAAMDCPGRAITVVDAEEVFRFLGLRLGDLPPPDLKDHDRQEAA